MKNQKLTFFALLFFLILIIPNQISAQKSYGIMPLRIKIVKKMAGNNSMWGHVNNPMMSSGKIIEEYNDRYFPLIEKALIEKLAKDGKTVAKINIDDLTKEERLEEEQFYNQIKQEIAYFVAGNTRTLLQPKKRKNNKKISKSAPLANKFGDKLEKDYLLFVVAMGHHFRRKMDEKKDKPYPEIAFGNMSLFGILVDSNNGNIEEYFEVKMAKSNGVLALPNTASSDKNVKMTDKRLNKVVSKFVKKLKKKVK